GLLLCRASLTTVPAALPLYSSLAVASLYCGAEVLSLVERLTKLPAMLERWTFVTAWLLGLLVQSSVAFFFERLSRHFDRPSLARRSRFLAVFSFTLIVADLLYLMYSYSNPRPSPTAVGVAIVIGTSWWLASLALSLGLTVRLRRAVNSEADRLAGTGGTMQVDDSPGGKWLRERSASLKWASFGFALLCGGVVLATLALAAPHVPVIAPELRSWRAEIVRFANAMVVTGRGFTLAGALCCLGAASASGNRALGMITCGALLLTLLLRIERFPTIAGVGTRTPTILEWMSLACEIACGVAFLFLMQRIFIFLGRRDLARRATVLIVAGLALVPLLVVFLSAGDIRQIRPVHYAYVVMGIAAIYFYAELAVCALTYGLYQNAREVLSGRVVALR
ncbi:MAG TPA: hypothetical protein VKB78_12145, partial [Pirellulales bacterium]|nr:hypothetical protein [Pirellulales bacterium]